MRFRSFLIAMLLPLLALRLAQAAETVQLVTYYDYVP